MGLELILWGRKNGDIDGRAIARCPADDFQGIRGLLFDLTPDYVVGFVELRLYWVST